MQCSALEREGDDTKTIPLRSRLLGRLPIRPSLASNTSVSSPVTIMTTSWDGALAFGNFAGVYRHNRSPRNRPTPTAARNTLSSRKAAKYNPSLASGEALARRI